MKKELSAIEYRPSGSVLPLVLQKAHSDAIIKNKDPPPRSRQLARMYPRDRQWTAEAIERALQKSWTALHTLQEQISRGEEAYYDETQTLAAGANIFRGWDSYPDARLNDNSNHYDNRRMPADFRWFSVSCADPRRFLLPVSAMPQVDVASVTKMELPPFDASKSSSQVKNKEDEEEEKRKETDSVPMDDASENDVDEDDQDEEEEEEEEERKPSSASKRKTETAAVSRRPKRTRRK